MIEKILNFFRRIFFNKNDFKETEDLLQDEIKRIGDIEKSLNEIKVIHEEISGVVYSCTKIHDNNNMSIIGDGFKDYFNKRLNTLEIVQLLQSNSQLYIAGMPRKERQFYSKKIQRLRAKKGMKIIFDKNNKSYKLQKK